MVALVIASMAGTPVAHGHEPEIATAAPAVIERDVDEATRRLRRDTNLVVIYEPDGSTEIRAYADGAGTAHRRAQARGSADAGERSTALHALLGSEVGLQAALDALAGDREPEVLRAALDVLTGYVTLPLEPIFAAVRNEDPGVRIQALELLTLHRGRDARVEEVLNRAASTDDDEDVRESARALIGASAPR